MSERLSDLVAVVALAGIGLQSQPRLRPLVAVALGACAVLLLLFSVCGAIGRGETAAAASVAVPASKSHMPKLYFTSGGATRELPLEKTQLAETKTKPSSMKSLAADSAVTQAMQSGINTVAYSAASHMNSGIGDSAVQQAGSVFAGVLSHRTPTVTYVWGVPSPASTNVLQTVSPNFAVDFSRAIGISADDYEPAIVRLTPAQNTCRIVGATQGKANTHRHLILGPALLLCI